MVVFPASDVPRLGRDRKALLCDGSLMGCGKQERGFSLEDIFNLATSFVTFNSLSYILITLCREINPDSPFVLIILNLHCFPTLPVFLWHSQNHRIPVPTFHSRLITGVLLVTSS